MSLSLADLIRSFRTLSGDKVQPFFSSDDDVKQWLNEAQAQACVRGRLIREDELDAVCRVPLTAGKHTYPLHPSVYELIDLWVQPGSSTGRIRPVDLKSREWLDAEVHEWRQLGRPACMAIQDDTTIRMVGTVETGDTLVLECYRLPIKPLVHPSDKPEIHAIHHQHLVQWALHRAFGIPDADFFDADRSGLAEREFTKYFGPLPDSDARRTTRVDQAHHNKAILP